VLSLYQKIAGILFLLLVAAGLGLGQPQGAIAASPDHSYPANVVQFEAAAISATPLSAAAGTAQKLASPTTSADSLVNPGHEPSYLEFTPRQAQRLLHSDLTRAMMTGSHLTSAHLFTGSLLSGEPVAATKTVASQP
jgi:hypothetical protein